MNYLILERKREKVYRVRSVGPSGNRVDKIKIKFRISKSMTSLAFTFYHFFYIYVKCRKADIITRKFY